MTKYLVFDTQITSQTNTATQLRFSSLPLISPHFTSSLKIITFDVLIITQEFTLVTHPHFLNTALTPSIYFHQPSKALSRLFTPLAMISISCSYLIFIVKSISQIISNTDGTGGINLFHCCLLHARQQRIPYLFLESDATLSFPDST
jgi:hypothetical protein